MDIRNSYFIIYHGGWNSARGWCVSRKKIHSGKSGIYHDYFFVSCHAIKLKVNGLNRLKAKNLRENLYQSLSFGVNYFPLDRRSPKFRTKIDGVYFKGANFVPFYRLQM